jgi:hypothetical protein
VSRAAAVLLPALALALALALARAAVAQDFVTVDRRLTDAEFHRLLSCGALPGAACTSAAMRWPPARARDLRVAVLPPEPGFPEASAAQVRLAVAAAVAEVNAVGAALRLRRVEPDARPDIRIRLTGLHEGDPIRDVPGIEPGTPMGAAHFRFDTDARNRITAAVILVAADIRPEHVASVLLEEIVQVTGLLHDVSGPAYHGASIFDEHTNVVTRLRGQDAAALRLHYPPP